MSESPSKRARTEEPAEDVSTPTPPAPDWFYMNSAARRILLRAVCGKEIELLFRNNDVKNLPLDRLINVDAVRECAAEQTAKLKREADTAYARLQDKEAELRARVEKVLTKFCGPVSDLVLVHDVEGDNNDCDTSISIKFNVHFTSGVSGCRRHIEMVGNIIITVNADTGDVTYYFGQTWGREDVHQNGSCSEEKLFALVREICVELGVAQSAAAYITPKFEPYPPDTPDPESDDENAVGDVPVQAV